ncbi:enolase-like isoform X1 [Bombus vosnesenskii]|uniref:Enolase n=2 Tax=Pyrobombus TaxID=144703 RepID=A0A6J3LGV2_9HYME|nr:enolase-like isoform X1 [Bombus impatiens]XP_033364485.1 enolase-like isoform X1 [Bombus vosnesenskii]XP_050487836.1 enolase-like isoform X1 [Bombus huntii]
MPIQKVKARQIFNSRGDPTLEVDIITDVGLLRSSVPSVLVPNPNQAQELRDGNEAMYHGRSVFRAVDVVNNIIAPQLLKSRLEACQQMEIDSLLNRLDGTENKSKLGANAILGVSIACCKAGAAKKGLPVYRYIAELAENGELYIPVPSFNMISGGRHANNTLPCQEFMILPIGAESFADAMKMGMEVYRVLERKIAAAQEIQLPLPVSDNGAFTPLELEEDKEALLLLDESIKEAGYEGRIKIALDMAASAFYKEGGYDLAFKTEESDPDDYMESEALKDQYLEYLTEFSSLVSIEDPFDLDDWDGWLTLADQDIQVVADDLTAMNIDRIEEAIERQMANAMVLRMSQVGTVTEAINCAKIARISDWGYIVTACEGETEDNFVADLAIGLSAGQFKAGAPCRSERTAKYNQILRIEEELGKDARYAGLNYRNPLAK